jgi:hypothetical protein
MVDAQRVKRPVLIAQSTPVAVQGEPGVALGGPLRRADVAFVSVALVHGVPVKPCHILPSRVVARRIRPNRAAPDHSLPDRSLSPLWGVSLPCQTVPRQVRQKTAVPHRAMFSHTESCPANRPYGRVLAKPSLTRSSQSVSCQPPTYRVAPCRPYGRIPALSYAVAPKQAEPGRVLFESAMPETAEYRLTETCRGLAYRALPDPVALAGVSLPCPVRPRHATPSRVSPGLVLPVRSTPCPDKQNPEHLRSRDLLKVHGGCTDVRDSTHERANKNSPRHVNLQQVQYTRNGRPCQQGVDCERT